MPTPGGHFVNRWTGVLRLDLFSVQDHGLNQVYIIGGDGTMRGAVKIYEEISRRKLKVSIVGIPKTVDNDIAIIDRCLLH